MILFLQSLVKAFQEREFYPKLFLEQMYEVGVRSILITVVSGLFVGGIMVLQIHSQLVDFGAESVLGGVATSVTLRNIGPVLIAFLLAGKVGAFTSAELGTMRVSSQIDALDCMGINSMSYLILPRLIAVTLSSFFLLVIGLTLTIIGGIIVATFQLKINIEQYLSFLSQFVDNFSLLIAFTKSFVFGLFIAIVSCYYGYTTQNGSLGVGTSVRKTSLVILVGIVLGDFFISILFSIFQEWWLLK